MKNSVDFIKSKIGDFVPEIGIILGSGLGDFADRFDSICVSYNDIPGFQPSKVEGHKGQLVFADIDGKKVVMMQGRYHFYEGYSMPTVVYPVKVLKKLGIKTLLVTNAAGATHKGFEPGDLMLIKDHINFMGTNPLIGTNDDALGVRFPDMSEIYKKTLRDKAHDVAQTLGFNLKEGVYAAVTGPSYETPTEIKMFHMLGADAVGMSTVPEAIVANYSGVNVLGISCLTNYAAGVSQTPLAHKEVIETADRVKEKFQKLVQGIIGAI